MGERDIGWAVDKLNRGYKVCRAGWNGKGMWLELDRGTADETEQRGRYGIDNFVWMKTAQNTYIPWLCSQADLLATDWELAE